MPTFEDVTDSGDAGGDGGITRKLVEEMVPFLRDPRPEIRQAAAATAVAASASKAGVALLHQCGAVKWLCRISGDVGTIAKDAVSALVNVSAEETSVAALEDMCKASIVSRMMEAASDEACLPAMRDLCLQLLANVTRVQLGAEKVAQVGVAGGAKEGQYIRKLARWLSLHPAEEGLPYPTLVGTSREDARVVDRRAALRDSHGSDDEEDGSGEHAGGGGGAGSGNAGRGRAAGAAVMDQWQHCASVLCNAARTAEGRKALRRPDPRVALSELLPELSSANPARMYILHEDIKPVRRWGIAGCVRNCCFEELDQAWLLHEVKVVPHLLMRLSDDADEYDFDEKVVLDPRVWRREEGAPPRRREPVQCIKRDVVEALLQLCAILDSRQSLRKMGVYFVIREVDKSEPDGEISQVCYNLVNFLQRDEQDKQARVDYLKNLAKEEADAEQASKEEKTREIEVMPAPGSPGSSADRKAFIRDKIIAENLAAKGGGQGGQKQKSGRGGAGEEEEEEEFVGDEGADAINKMLASFDDSDDEE